MELDGPVLNQRRRCGEQQKGNSDSKSQLPENGRNRGINADNRMNAGQVEVEKQKGPHQKGDVNCGLFFLCQVRQNMGISISADENRLEKNHAGGPYGLTSPEQGDQLFGEHWLHLEEQERREEDRQREWREARTRAFHAGGNGTGGNHAGRVSLAGRATASKKRQQQLASQLY